MATFPTLGTGAVAQYPLPVSYTLPVEIIRFIDGASQRFAARGKTLRSWHVQLTALSDDELFQLEQFFDLVQGNGQLFDFPDPYSGNLVPNCRLADPSFTTDYLATDIGSTSFWVLEFNG